MQKKMFSLRVTNLAFSSSSSTTTPFLSMSASNNNKLSSNFYFVNFLLIVLILSFISKVDGQDFYGTSYANNRSPDEIRQRSRNNLGFDDPQQPQGPVDDGGRQGCPGPWQWQCDSGHCIAQYDLCDGVTQCPDESDEKNCRGRFGPSQHISSYRQHPEAEPKQPLSKPSTTSVPTTNSHTASKDNGSILLPLKLVFAGAAAFILVAGLTHVFVKRRQLQATARNYRKGQKIDDDEEGLLISALYN
jgi:hypothetical protein